MVKKILLSVFVYVPAAFVAISLLLVLVFKWAPLVGTPLMLRRSLDGVKPAKYEWTALDDISDNMKRAVIASEDNKFFTHNGFDFEEIDKMLEKKSRGGRVRGCSTISQQTAKNCFTFGTRTWVRKGFEAWFTVLIEKIWGKRRILEVYLNIAEMGRGIYGTEAAAMEYYGKHAAKLTLTESTAIACCLPSPLKRTPAWVMTHMPNHRPHIASIARGVSLKPLESL